MIKGRVLGDSSNNNKDDDQLIQGASFEKEPDVSLIFGAGHQNLYFNYLNHSLNGRLFSLTYNDLWKTLKLAFCRRFKDNSTKISDRKM